MPNWSLSDFLRTYARRPEPPTITVAAGASRLDASSITSLVIDSRKVEQGSLFIALSGASVDGHDYVRRAVEQGARAVLVASARAEEFEDLGESVPVLTTATPRATLGHLAAHFFGDPLTRFRAVLGVTGTNGKTTSSFIAESLLLHRDRYAVGVIGTINYRWTVPSREVAVVKPAPNTTPESLVVHELAHQMLCDGVEILVMEVSSHGLETHRLNAVLFHGAMFTNLTQDHLDFHGSMQAYRAAKKKLFFEHLRPSDGVAALYMDDPVGEEWAQELDRDEGFCGKVSGYGTAEVAPGPYDVMRVRATRSGLEGTRVEMAHHASDVAFEMPLVGEFNVANVLGVFTLVSELELMSIDELVEAAPFIHSVPGRLQRVNPGEQPAVFVDYAHTPDALAHVLETLAPFCSGILWCVFGCGGDRDRGKRPLMGRVALEGAGRLVLTSDNPRKEPPMQIIDEIIAGIGEDREAVVVEPERALAIRYAVTMADSEDVILIAGKGHENYQELGTGRVHFDDVEQAFEDLKHRGA